MGCGWPEAQFPALSPVHTAYGTVRQSMQHTADAKLYATYHCCHLAQCVVIRRRTDGHTTQHAAQISGGDAITRIILTQ